MTDRVEFLDAMGRVWDTARNHAQTQLRIATLALREKGGGMLLVRPECQFPVREVPEAAYIAEGFTFVDLGYGRTVK